jgi:hypothetical protein
MTRLENLERLVTDLSAKEWRTSARGSPLSMRRTGIAKSRQMKMPGKLDELAEQALTDHRAGRTRACEAARQSELLGHL